MGIQTHLTLVLFSRLHKVAIKVPVRILDHLGSQQGKTLPASSFRLFLVTYGCTMQETRVQSLGQEDPLEKEMAIHSSILAWRIPWMEELGRLQSMGSQRDGHN